MNYDRFIGLVQSRARMPSRANAVAATRATLETLAERIDPHEAHHLASQLPREIGIFLENTSSGDTGERFSFDAFCQRVAHREEKEVSTALFHARCVLETVQEAVSAGEMRDVRSQLPSEFERLFAAEGRM